jgi:hypothetical protein
MTAWTSEELDSIGRAEELKIASAKHDASLRSPTTIWVVRVGDDLFVRSVRGRSGAWFRGTQDLGEGRIWAGRVEKDVIFSDTDRDLGEQIDAAYRTKYGRDPASIVGSVLTSQARSATVNLVPRSMGS